MVMWQFAVICRLLHFLRSPMQGKYAAMGLRKRAASRGKTSLLYLIGKINGCVVIYRGKDKNMLVGSIIKFAKCS